MTHYMVRRGVVGSLEALSAPFDGELARALTPNGWEAAVPGPVVDQAYRCRINGDGYRYKAQAMLDGAGTTIGLVTRYDLGTSEL